ncbi:MAG TPA: polymer-forming cytoskeletal protein [Steroidobacteraceae bacterium]|nr:polymer-forming cytoskeletal protein [Steroidobacteraceae bacterium]
MFKREAKEDLPIETLISASTRIQGDVSFSGGLHLEGKVSGSVRATPDAPSRLVASATALIEGSVEAQIVELHGTVRGDIIAARRATLGATACIEGNLHYGAIEMSAGARINGKLVKL